MDTAPPRLHGTPVGRLQVKRLGLPGCLITVQCPECRTEVVRDLDGDHPLGYPDVNAPLRLALYCPACDHEWALRARLKVELVLEAGDPPPARHE